MFKEKSCPIAYILGKHIYNNFYFERLKDSSLSCLKHFSHFLCRVLEVLTRKLILSFEIFIKLRFN